MFRSLSRLGRKFIGLKKKIHSEPSPTNARTRSPTPTKSTTRLNTTPLERTGKPHRPKLVPNWSKQNSHFIQHHHNTTFPINIKVNSFLFRPPEIPQLPLPRGKVHSIAELSAYRAALVKYQLTMLHYADKSSPLTPPAPKHLLSMARTLMSSARGIITAGTGMVAYHGLLNFVVWSRYTYNNLETYHPELLDTEHITFTKLMMLVEYLLQAAESSLKYYVPHFYDLWFLLYQSFYLPTQRFRLNYILNAVNTNDQQREKGNLKCNKCDQSAHNGENDNLASDQNASQNGQPDQKYSHIHSFSKSEQLHQIMVQNHYRLSKRRKNPNMGTSRVCELSGNKIEDVVRVQKYCIENIQVVENLISELEKLYFGCETIYMASFYNMKELSREVEMRKQLYAALLKKNESNLGQDDVQNEQNAVFQQHQTQNDNSPSNNRNIYSLAQYFNLPTSSAQSGPISIDNSFLSNCHVYDQLEGIPSGFEFLRNGPKGQNSTQNQNQNGQHSTQTQSSRFLSALSFDFTTSQTKRLEDNVQGYIYDVYHDQVEQLPLFIGKRTFDLNISSDLSQLNNVNDKNVTLFWDFNIASYYDMALHQRNQQQQQQQQQQPLHKNSPHLHRQLESASLSICNNSIELSHTTIDSQSMKLMNNGNGQFRQYQNSTPNPQNPQNPQNSAQNGQNPPDPSALTPETLLNYFPLPVNIKELIYSVLDSQLNAEESSQQQSNSIPQLDDLLFAANFSQMDPSLKQQGLERLERKRLSQLPSMEAFSLENKIELQAYLQSTIQDLKRLVVHQYDLHQRVIVPEVVLDLQRKYGLEREHFHQDGQQNGQNGQNGQNLEDLLQHNALLSSKYSQSELSSISHNIDNYYNESIAHLTFNIAMVDETTALLKKLTSFLSPHYIIANPLYFSLFAKNQFSPHLGRSVDRFVLNLNQNGMVAMGKVPAPYISELNHFDDCYTADAFIFGPKSHRNVQSSDQNQHILDQNGQLISEDSLHLDPNGGYDNIAQVIAKTAMGYVKDSTLLSQYQRAKKLHCDHYDKFETRRAELAQQQLESRRIQHQQQRSQQQQIQQQQISHQQQLQQHRQRQQIIQNDLFNKLGQDAADAVQNNLPMSFDV